MSRVDWQLGEYEQEQELTLQEVADQVRAGTHVFEQVRIVQGTEPAAHLELCGCSFAASSFNRADLRLASFQGAYLLRTFFSNCDLRGAVFGLANLTGATFYNCSIQGANLTEANATNATITDGSLAGANLCDVNLRAARFQPTVWSDLNARGANFNEASMPDTFGIQDVQWNYSTVGLAPAPEGELVGWGLKSGCILRFLIPRDIPRSWATTRKLRAAEVITQQITTREGSELDELLHHSSGYSQVLYRVGEVTCCDRWDPCRWHECSHGIHFFLTRHEAEEWKE